MFEPFLSLANARISDTRSPLSLIPVPGYMFVPIKHLILPMVMEPVLWNINSLHQHLYPSQKKGHERCKWDPWGKPHCSQQTLELSFPILRIISRLVVLFSFYFPNCNSIPFTAGTSGDDYYFRKQLWVQAFRSGNC